MISASGCRMTIRVNTFGSKSQVVTAYPSSSSSSRMMSRKSGELLTAKMCFRGVWRRSSIPPLTVPLEPRRIHTHSWARRGVAGCRPVTRAAGHGLLTRIGISVAAAETDVKGQRPEYRGTRFKTLHAAGVRYLAQVGRLVVGLAPTSRALRWGCRSNRACRTGTARKSRGLSVMESKRPGENQVVAVRR